MIGLRTWLLARQVEKELLTFKSAGRTLHRKTIRALALFEALNEDVPTYSVLHGFATLSTLLVDDLTQRGMPVPRQLSAASRELVSLASEIVAQWDAQQAK